MTKLKDIARASGFSITTVSRALAGYDDVSEETRRRITDIALDMSYQPNVIARQLRSQKTDTLGIIIAADSTRFSDDFFSELLMGVGYSAASYGYDLLVSAQTSTDEMSAYRRIIGGNRVDGVIVARTRRNDPRIAYLKAKQHPFVVSGRGAPDELSDFPYIDADSQAGLRLIVNHLTALGHQHIGLILPPTEMAFTTYRLMGYQQGLSDAAVPFRESYAVHGDLRRSGGEQAAHELLKAHPQLTAIVACNDAMALGAMQAVKALGLRVGSDIAVTGFDNIPTAEYADPPLTTVSQPIQEIGQHLVEMLIQIIHQRPLSEPHVLLSPKLIVRDSCGAKVHPSSDEFLG
jgi:LacI family transcriptional regulator